MDLIDKILQQKYKLKEEGKNPTKLTISNRDLFNLIENFGSADVDFKLSMFDLTVVVKSDTEIEVK